MATSSLQQRTFHGIVGGINQAIPSHEIDDRQAVWVQDALIDVPGIVRKRGPVQPTASVSAVMTSPPQGIHATLAVDGRVRLSTLVGRSNPRLNFLNSAYSSTTGLTWPGSWATSDPLWDSKPALNGGSFIGASDSLTASGTPGMALWRGAGKAQYTADGITASITTTKNSKIVTGTSTTFSSNVEPGMFVMAYSGTSVYLVGVVASVDSATQLTLVQNAFHIATNMGFYIQSARGLGRRLAKGRITTSATSSRVTGAGTKFKQLDPIAGTWKLFRASDMVLVGTPLTIESNTSILLGSNAEISMANEKYVMVQTTFDTNAFRDFDAQKHGLGILSAVYQGRQFYANLPKKSDEKVFTSRVWWSDTSDPEAVDMDPIDGDFFDVTSQGHANTPILAIAGLQNSLAILKENELYALYGNDPSQWQLRKIADIGTICTMGVIQHENGIIFPSKTGVFFFDGVTLTNLTQSLGDFWVEGIKNFNGETDRAYGFVFRNHYLLHITDFSSSYKVRKGTVSTSITEGTLAINLVSGGLTWLTNVKHKGGTRLPSSSSAAVWYVIEESTTTACKICDAADLWANSGSDTIQAAGSSALGPDFYIESKRFDVGQAAVQKLWKQLILEYKLTGDQLTMDTMVGLRDEGVTNASKWLPSLDWIPKRMKFTRRSTHIGFRLYETAGTADTLQIGPWALAYKWRRVGRI